MAGPAHRTLVGSFQREIGTASVIEPIADDGRAPGFRRVALRAVVLEISVRIGSVRGPRLLGKIRTEPDHPHQDHARQDRQYSVQPRPAGHVNAPVMFVLTAPFESEPVSRTEIDLVVIFLLTVSALC